VGDTLLVPAPEEPGTSQQAVALPTVRQGHAYPLALIAAQARYTVRQILRTPVAAFFTVVLPVVILLLIGSITGNAVIDARGGIRIAQYTTPAITAFAVAMAVFMNPAISVVLARESGMLKRLRGTPLPAAAYLTGKLVGATLVAAISVVLVVGVAMVAFDVRLIGAQVPAGFVTLLVGVVTFAALGFAVAAVAPTVTAAAGIANGSIILLSFVSEIFLIAETMPSWLSTIGDVFPLKHLVNGLQDAFDPYLEGSPWGWEHLAVMGAWALAGTAVALWRFDWQPRSQPTGTGIDARTATPGRRQQGHLVALVGDEVGTALPTARSHRPTLASTWRGQVAYADRQVRRDLGSIAFAVVMPALLVLLLPAVFGTGEMPWRDGIRFPQFYAPAMAVYGIAVHAFVNVPESVAAARDRGMLKRLRGTPLSVASYLGGRLTSILLIGAVVLATTIGIGAVLYEVEVPAGRLVPLLVTFLVGTLSIAALGLLLAGLVRRAASVPAVALGILLPLCFVSDVFMLGDVPTVVAVIGWIFPVKHFVHAMVNAIDPAWAAGGWSFDHLAVLLAWGMVGAVVAARTFRWEPAVAAGVAQRPEEMAATPAPSGRGRTGRSGPRRSSRGSRQR
jgi:ABC-2 type transport system permease protein